jgi:hypothetical protein
MSVEQIDDNVINKYNEKINQNFMDIILFREFDKTNNISDENSKDHHI